MTHQPPASSIQHPPNTAHRPRHHHPPPTIHHPPTIHLNSEFDVITNSLSSDYLTSPLEVFTEMNRVLKPGGTASMAFTNRYTKNLRSCTNK